MANYILGYTREPINNILYDTKLAYSLHLAVSYDGVNYCALNHNSGVLFARATENEDGSLNAMSLKMPWIFQMKDSGYGVVAVRILGDGEDDESSKGAVLFWRTSDFIRYEEDGLVFIDDKYIAECVCAHTGDDNYELLWENDKGEFYKVIISCISGKLTEENSRKIMSECENITEEEYRSRKQSFSVPFSPNENFDSMEGAVCHNQLEVSEYIASRLVKKLNTPINIGIEFPAEVSVSSREELLSMKAKAIYSDGGTDYKKIDWNMEKVDFDRTGCYEICGQVHQDHFAFPLVVNRADPDIAFWKGKYYFISTNDADREHTIYVREADSISGLADATDHLILDAYTYEGIGGLLWAPEFHEINGRLYIFHAATPGEFYCEESHIMVLREGGNLACAADWSRPQRVVRADGSELCEMGKTITLDMTCFEWQNEWYAVWSQRQFLPKDLGAWLYIARLNPEKPWMLASEPVVLSKPDYGWGNNHTFVEEGPFALFSHDKLYITFSAAATDTSYVVSYLVIDKNKNLLEAVNWRKNNYPILTSRCVEGEFGTGHNAYVKDKEGQVWNVYHARLGVDGARCTGIRRVHFDGEGEPVLGLTEERDLDESCKYIKTMVIVRHK